jgi:hypothetical protein
MIGFGTNVQSPDGDVGKVTWVGQQFPDGHKVKVKWSTGGSTLILTDTLTEVIA